MTPQHYIEGMEKRFDIEFLSPGEATVVSSEVRLKSFFRSEFSTFLTSLAAEVEGRKKTHRVFECNGAHGGKGCFESWCEDQNCRSQDAVEVRAHNAALDEVLALIKSHQL